MWHVSPSDRSIFLASKARARKGIRVFDLSVVKVLEAKLFIYPRTIFAMTSTQTFPLRHSYHHEKICIRDTPLSWDMRHGIPDTLIKCYYEGVVVCVVLGLIRDRQRCGTHQLIGHWVPMEVKNCLMGFLRPKRNEERSGLTTTKIS
jgi:hypothetical protein